MPDNASLGYTKNFLTIQEKQNLAEERVQKYQHQQ